MQEFDGPAGPGAPPADESPIRDVDMSTFMEDVIEKSMHVPILVSFWSDWSENCRKLGPVLEKVIRKAGGAVQMVRVNFDQNKQLAAQMKIQSVPTVVVFSGQRPVDAFAGVKTEAEIKEFVSRFAPDMQPSPAEQMIDHGADLFAAGDYEAAGGAYSQAMQLEPDNAAAIGGLAQCLIRMGDLENAETVLGSVPSDLDHNPAVLAARAALDMAVQLADLGDAATLEAALAKDALDHQARFDLALLRWAEGDRECAADHLLEIVRRDRAWREDAARKQLVKFFEIAGPMEPFTVKKRKQLSSLLFS